MLEHIKSTGNSEALCLMRSQVIVFLHGAAHYFHRSMLSPGLVVEFSTVLLDEVLATTTPNVDLKPREYRDYLVRKCFASVFVRFRHTFFLKPKE